MRASLPVLLTIAALLGGCVLLGVVAPQHNYRSLFQDKETPEQETASTESCAKYEEHGPLVVSGCERCAAVFPGRNDQKCMSCGLRLCRLCGDRSDTAACIMTEDIRECIQACIDAPTPKGSRDTSRGGGNRHGPGQGASGPR
jgi:hypothetical protein